MTNYGLLNKYIYQLNLDGLIETGNKFNSRCPICRDSEKKKHKRRFYILADDQQVTCYCHNCGLNTSFHSFIKDHFPAVYDEYRKDYLMSKIKKWKKFSNDEIRTKAQESIKKIVQPKDYLYKNFVKVKDHPKSLKYCLNRNLTEQFIGSLYYCENFLKWISENTKKEIQIIPDIDERIVIPFFNSDSELTHLQGRAINNNTELRYITVTLDETAVKVWGMDKLNINEIVYILEGPIDASFINNSISFASANPNFEYLTALKQKKYFVFDTDIRKNKNIRDIANKCLDHSIGIVIFPKQYWKYKDINEMIQNGMNANLINTIVKENSFDGLKAKTMLAMIRSL